MEMHRRYNNSQIIWLLVLVCFLTIVSLTALYSWIYKLAPQDAIFELIRNIIPGFIGALIAYLVVYFLFIQKGISLNLDQQLEAMRGIQENLSITSSSIIIRGITTKMQDLNEPFKSDLKLYTFWGLQDETESDILQDFNMRGTNVNAIQFLWADASAGNIINAKINENQFLNISFDNKSSAGSNVAIRLASDKARLKLARMRYITFDARIEEKHEKVVVGIRVVNGWLQHWHYSNMPDSFRTIVLGRCCTIDPQITHSISNGKKYSDWESFSIDLEDPTKWHLFNFDGNHLYGADEVDFSIITSIIFEVGIAEDGQEGALNPRPGRGKGELDIRQIRFTETPEHLI